MPKSAYAEMMRGIHRPEAHAADPAIVADPYKMAMYGATATGIDVDMTVYKTDGETSGTGYTAGGFACSVSVVDAVISGKDGEAYTFAPIAMRGNPLAFSFRYAVCYRDAGTIKRVLFIVDHGSGSVQTVSGNSAVYAPATGTNMFPIMITPL